MNVPNKTQAESNTIQPTGSSKRKRKHSIKRNIVLDDKSNCSDSAKLSKIEKTNGKKSKVEKSKPEKDICKEVEKNNSATVDVSQSVHDKSPVENPVEDISQKIGMYEKQCKHLSKEPVQESGEGIHCSSTKQDSENCKLCLEEGVNKSDGNDPKKKQLRYKKKFTCDICAKNGSVRTYNSAEKHKQHMVTVHEIYGDEIKRFECTDCPETVWFPTKAKLTYHLGTKHPGVMRFVCEVCTETFILKTNYKSHLKTHNIIVHKKFSCDVCKGTFVNKTGFEAHKKRFPGPHIKQSCTHCGFSFSREKHMKNHRCKTLLLEEAAARANKAQEAQETSAESTDPLKLSPDLSAKSVVVDIQVPVDKKTTETLTETESSQKKTAHDSDSQASKRVVFHRIVPRRNQDQAVYRPVQMQSQNVSESVVVQELREVDLESGTFVAAAANEPEPQFIVRDLNGHLLQGNQILQLDFNDGHQGEENQVYLADWNIVAPYVIREKSP